ncbi:MAG: cytochrome C biogenesis protein [Actinobacteria bacterium]|nr:cytochrome C biogenesis protein [Actinomycetota bacterium]
MSSLTLPLVLGAGLADGFNPCAFAVLLVFVTSTLALLERRVAHGESSHARLTLLGMGGIYIFGVFLTYLTLGMGILGTTSFLSRTHVVSRGVALMALVLGLLLLREALLPELGAILTVPLGLHATMRRWIRKTSIPGLFGAGVLVGLCTVPCSGAIYLAILALLASQTTWLQGFAYLVLYNLAFILPLVILLLMASSRLLLNRLGRWQLYHRNELKLALGGATVLLGLGILMVA